MDIILDAPLRGGPHALLWGGTRRPLVAAGRCWTAEGVNDLRATGEGWDEDDVDPLEAQEEAANNRIEG